MRRWVQVCPRQAVGLCLIGLGGLMLTACADSGKSSKVDPKYGVRASPRVVQPGQPVPKGGGTYRVGKPYVVAGRWYYPEENRRYRANGIASWYGADFHGRLTANGEVYDMDAISAAHPTLPMPSYARVTNLRTGRSLIVRVNDRGPFHADRVIDLSSKAAELLQVRRPGTEHVQVEYAGPAALEGSDDRRLLATLRNGRGSPAPSPVRVASARPSVPEARARMPSADHPPPERARGAPSPEAFEWRPSADAGAVSRSPLPPLSGREPTGRAQPRGRASVPATAYAEPLPAVGSTARGLY